MISAEMLRAVYESGMEDTKIPEKILAYLATKDGKKLTARDEPHLKQIEPECYIRKSAGMTTICWGGYHRSGGNQGGSLLIAYAEGAPTIDAKWVEERNPAYFSAAKERNAKRQAILADPKSAEVFAELAAAIDDTIKARDAIKRTLTDYEAPLHEARYNIRKLVKDTFDFDIWP